MPFSLNGFISVFYGAGEMAQCLGASVSMKTCIQSQHHEETFLELRLAEEESSGEGVDSCGARSV